MTFFRKKLGGEDFFTIKFEIPRFNLSKKAIFEDQKVIYVGLSGVRDIQKYIESFS